VFELLWGEQRKDTTGYLAAVGGPSTLHPAVLGESLLGH